MRYALSSQIGRLGSDAPKEVDACTNREQENDSADDKPGAQLVPALGQWRRGGESTHSSSGQTARGTNVCMSAGVARTARALAGLGVARGAGRQMRPRLRPGA